MGLSLLFPLVHWWLCGVGLVVLLWHPPMPQLAGDALVCTRAQAPPHGCCTRGELRLGEVVAIQNRLKKEEVEAEAQAKVKDVQGEGRGSSWGRGGGGRGEE